jgi:membrane-bound lytic murein transglycosylase B
LRTLRIALATGVVAVTMAQIALAADPATTTTVPAATTTTTTQTPPPPPPAGTTTTPTTGVTVTPVPVPQPVPTPNPPKPSGKNKGSSANGKGSKQNGKQGKTKNANATGKQGAAATGAAVAPTTSSLGSLGPAGLAPTSCTTGASAPPYLLPIYQQASDAYGLGPQGPGVLAAINGIESGFGTNLGPSSAGAVGWMQFMPSTWAIYGVDANGDGQADPNNPQDAIFAAARYLQAAGMPADTPGAIFAYNHADWYVADVLANAGCYGGAVGTFATPLGMQTYTCKSAPDVHVPLYYMQAFEDAASRFGLGERGVWALAGVARLESNFGRSMPPGQLLSSGPLGLDRSEWNRFEIDGDGDGRIEHISIEDSAATLAREIWSRGDLRAGLFLHNQAEWYVQEVLDQANKISGHCSTTITDWSVALPQAALSNPLPGWQRGRIDMGVDFSAQPGTPIRSPFDAVVVRVGAPGWPGGGGGVLLQPAHGQYVYIYESVQAAVQPGQPVQAGQVIGFGSATSSSTGIEIGFADASGAPLAHSVYIEGAVTAWGQRMDAFLTQLGAP